MNDPKQVLSMLIEIWPKAKDWMPASILGELANRIARFGLDAGQIKAVLIDHALTDDASGKPRSEKLLARLKVIHEGETNARNPTPVNTDGDTFIEMQRRIQGKQNRAALDQPGWKILAAWFDHEFTNRQATPDQRLQAAKYVASMLRAYGAPYNDSVYAAAAIYELDPFALNRHIAESLVLAMKARLRSPRVMTGHALPSGKSHVKPPAMSGVSPISAILARSTEVK